jgi:hypothetical protein
VGRRRFDPQQGGWTRTKPEKQATTDASGPSSGENADDAVHFIIEVAHGARIPLAYRVGVALGSQPWGVKDAQVKDLVVEMLGPTGEVLQAFPADSHDSAVAIIHGLQSELTHVDDLALFLHEHGVPTQKIAAAVASVHGPPTHRQSP